MGGNLESYSLHKLIKQQNRDLQCPERGSEKGRLGQIPI